MSVYEDTELRDLVAQTLETNGVLGKIRAQLRANVFLALEEQDAAKNKPPYVNPELKKFLGTNEGRMVTSLVREFLQFFDLEYTLAVFDPEIGLGEHYESRANLAREYNIIESNVSDSAKAPLLVEVVKRGAGDPTVLKGRTSSTTTEGSEFISVPKDLGLKHLQQARMKFDAYDKDKNGSIDKDELRALFADMFPSFHRNMLERYVTDEFKAVDKDFSNNIDFEEFLDMYKRLFVLCKSVVSHDVSDITLASPRRLSDTAPATRIPSRTKKTDSIEEEDESKPGNLPDISEKSPRTPTSPKTPSEKDDDSFFDDPLPDNSREKEISGEVKTGKTTSRASHIPVRSPRSDKHSSFKKDSETKGAGGSAMSSLAGLPSLVGIQNNENNESTTPRMPDITKEDLADIDKHVGNDDDYDEDFESSNPMGATPRSARSDHNVKSMEDEEIEEDIQEEISIVDDFLKSDNSGADDLTTDRTVSPTDQSTTFDYMEEVIS